MSVEVICKICGKTEQVMECRARNYHTCSVECLSKYNSIRYDKKTIITCVICNKEFKVKPSQIKRRRTCSKECLKELKKITMKGEKNHQYGLKGNKNSSYKGEITSDKKYSHIYIPEHPFCDKSGRLRYHRYLAEKFLLTDEYSIEINGKKFLNPKFDVHHVDFNTKNNDINNLKIVTRGEHSRIHCLNRIMIRDNKGKFLSVVLKQGELLKSLGEDNQHPSLSSNTLEGSTTSNRVLSNNIEDSNITTSALPK